MAESWFPLRTSLKELVSGRGSYRVTEVHGHGGGMALGAVQAGFELAARRDDPAALGLGVVHANRGVLGARWSVQASPPGKWRLVTTDVVVGTPAPDAVSTVITYAAKLKPAAVVMDFAASVVDDGFTGGLLKGLVKLTKTVYRPTTVVYNDLSVGGALDRRRTFLILSQVPIGVGRVLLDWIPTARDAVSDLSELETTWEAQRILRPPTWYSRPLRSPEHTVDGLGTAYDYRTGLDWDWHKPGRMPDADGVLRVKSLEDRALTHREIARLMGFPDTWLLGTAPRGRDGRFLGAYWEKTTSVYPARWVMGWVHDCLNGSPGPLTDVIDISEDWHKTAALVWPESV